MNEQTNGDRKIDVQRDVLPEHSPAPWTVTTNEALPGIEYVRDARGDELAVVYNADERPGVAQLLATSSKLLAALKAEVSAAPFVACSDEHCIVCPNDKARRDSSLAAIAEAEGRK